MSGTARFERVVLASMGLLLLAGLLLSCAGRRAAPQAPHQVERSFWTGCQETIPAKADGFQHFVCRDVRERHWEVLVRKR